MQNRHLLLALPLAAVMSLPVLAQDQTKDTQKSDQTTNQTQPQSQTPSQTTSDQQSSQQTQATSTQSSERPPLQLEQKEGFWGKVNPFARKKYVRKQLTPVVGRVNELDELTASNSKMIKDVDSRAQEGIRMASLKANEADTHALDATNRANQAHETASQTNNRLQNVEKVVSNIDQYQRIQDTEIRFRPGQLALSDKAKAALDELAVPLKQQKGYVVEVQGFSSSKGQAGIQSSQKMADAVVRYLVLQHDVPVYRIFTVGMGNAPVKTAAETTGQQRKRLRGGRVEIALLRNNLSDLESAQAGAAPPSSPTGQESAAPATSANPSMQQEQVPPNAPPAAQHPKVESQTPPKEQAPTAPPK
jgi:outer membrane protein OmpA-like peptidoglycan-associated protein